MAITFSNVPANAAASQVYVEQEATTRGITSAIIQRGILIIGQYNVGKSPTPDVAQLIISRDDAWTRYGRGSMLATMLITALDNAGGANVYALPVDDKDGAVEAVGTATFTGAATQDGVINYILGGQRFTSPISTGDTFTQMADRLNDAIGALPDLNVSATSSIGVVTLTTKWAGESGNQLTLVLDPDYELPGGVTLAIVDIGDATAGATDPDIDDALDGLGDGQYTDVILPYTGAVQIAAMEAAGDARDDPAVDRMFAGFVGWSGTSAELLTELDSRNSEWTTYVPVFGGLDPEFMLATAGGVVFSSRQQAEPGRPVRSLILPGIMSGDLNGITAGQRDQLVKAGGSHTRNLEDGRVAIVDLVTTRTTEDGGADTTDWRHTLIISNLQFKRNSLRQLALSDPFTRAVVADDGSGRGPSYILRPSVVKAYLIALVDDWVGRGLSKLRDQIVGGIVTEIDDNNPGRINALIPDSATAGLRIVAIKLAWAFT